MSKTTPISGFPEFLPAEQIVFNYAQEVIRKHCERVGAVPIETPAVERVDTLTAKGGNEKEIYALRRLSGEEGDDAKDLALRFDLTVPTGRYVVQHAASLTFPFRRYQMQPVWRGERPQSGRYRQFVQCDIDVIGEGSLSLLNDAEMPVVINRIFMELKIGAFTIGVNNRKILTGFLKSIGLESEASATRAMKAIDDLEKVGAQQTRDRLRDLNVADAECNRLIEFFSSNLKTDDTLALVRNQVVNEEMEEGLNELETVVQYMRMMGLPESNFRVDPSIARGLDYYTGTVYETRLNMHPGLGSICSGGRYDKLLRMLGADRDLPGVGISIGLTRLLPRLIAAGVMTVGPATVAPVLVTTMDSDQMEKYLKLGTVLRDAGINTEIYTEAKKLAAQMKYANRKGFNVVVIAGEQEFSTDTLIVRRLVDGEQVLVPQRELVATVAGFLGDSK